MSTANEAFFILSAVFAIGGAVGTVLAKSPLRAAIALLVNITSLAGLFLTLHAELLAVIQLIVYAGAVVVLFVFVIMLIGPAAKIPRNPRGMVARTVSLAVMSLLGVVLTFGLAGHDAPIPGLPALFGTVQGLGRELYQEALVPFELVGVALLVAIVGAVAVARGRTASEAQEEHRKRSSQAQEEADRVAQARRLADEVAAHEHGTREAAE